MKNVDSACMHACGIHFFEYNKKISFLLFRSSVSLLFCEITRSRPLSILCGDFWTLENLKIAARDLLAKNFYLEKSHFLLNSKRLMIQNQFIYPCNKKQDRVFWFEFLLCALVIRSACCRVKHHKGSNRRNMETLCNGGALESGKLISIFYNLPITPASASFRTDTSKRKSATQCNCMQKRCCTVLSSHSLIDFRERYACRMAKTIKLVNTLL